MLTLLSANVNGVRAALRNGGLHQLGAAQAAGRADVICLQEVRATTDQLHECLGEAGFEGAYVVHDSSTKLGHAGAAIISRMPLEDAVVGLGNGEFAEVGRWAEATVDHPDGAFVVASIYVPTGDAERPEKQAEKYRFLDAMTKRMRAHQKNGAEAILAGDLNVAHRKVDLKNWKGNLKAAGFLPEERAYFDAWLDKHGWVDLHRRAFGDMEGPYTWWSQRGQAFDNNVGWRIDYILATPGMAARCTDMEIGRAASYAERWSDHAAVTARFA
jgi:exodeoxyribonuclease-3